MNRRNHGVLASSIVIAALALGGLTPAPALAHCDTLDGPVVADARRALAAGEVTPVLKWVQAGDEPAIREAFSRTMAVRALGAEAQALADQYFFETLVRIHRAGEGAPFTGLKAAGAVDPVAVMADKALEQGSVDGLIAGILAHTDEGIRARFARALVTRRQAGESVAAGREYVEAYVTYVHYVEGIVASVHAAHGHAAEPASSAAHRH